MANRATEPFELVHGDVCGLCQGIISEALDISGHLSMTFQDIPMFTS